LKSYLSKHVHNINIKDILSISILFLDFWAKVNTKKKRKYGFSLSRFPFFTENFSSDPLNFFSHLKNFEKHFLEFFLRQKNSPSSKNKGKFVGEKRNFTEKYFGKHFPKFFGVKREIWGGKKIYLIYITAQTLNSLAYIKRKEKRTHNKEVFPNNF
jgi:hypothetical protein